MDRHIYRINSLIREKKNCHVTCVMGWHISGQT